jgi:inner membrane protein involved in colicin E2 resistance
MMRYQKENQVAREQLENDIKRYLASGHKIEQVPLGKSTPVDATNNWPLGFYNDDNVTFKKKVPRHV